jgi:hypothetical protein
MRKETRQGELERSTGTDKECRQTGWGGPRTRRQTWFRVPRANSLLTGCKMNSGSNYSSNPLASAWYGLCIVRTCSPICPNATTTMSEKCSDGSKFTGCRKRSIPDKPSAFRPLTENTQWHSISRAWQHRRLLLTGYGCRSWYASVWLSEIGTWKFQKKK